MGRGARIDHNVFVKGATIAGATVERSDHVTGWVKMCRREWRDIYITGGGSLFVGSHPLAKASDDVEVIEHVVLIQNLGEVSHLIYEGPCFRTMIDVTMMGDDLLVYRWCSNRLRLER